MFIKEIIIENNPIIGSLKLDFTNNKGNVCETIIIGGENGTGKSTILDIIFQIGNFSVNTIQSNEKRIFKIILSETEKQLFITEGLLTENLLDNEIILEFDYSIINDWSYFKVKHKSIPVNGISSNGEFGGVQILSKIKIKNLFSSIFSEVGINYTSQPKNTVTSKSIDEILTAPIKSPPNLADEITQLLIDIDVQDAQELQNYIKKNGNFTDELISKRIKRFTNAFDYMFENKKFKEIKTISNGKDVIFEEQGRECNINQLSSGEKQIVFRGSFLLQNKNSINGNLVLIDEPEISLHPNWQLKILDFYKNLFKNKEGIQQSQLIIVTHSPFIINNPNRLNDKVITLSKKDGITIVDDKPHFFGFSNIQDFVNDSFNLDLSILESSKPIILSEGKNYKYLIEANKYFGKDLNIEIKEIDDLNTSQLKSLFDSLIRINIAKNKIFIIWDIDYKKEYNKLKVRGTELIIPMIFEANSNNTDIPGGIENMFNSDKLPKLSGYYKEKTNIRNDGGKIFELNKVIFEKFILDNSSEELFCNFGKIFKHIKTKIT